MFPASGFALLSLRRICVIAGIVFVIALAWMVLLFQGLPASDIDDWDKIIMSRDVSWRDFSSSFFTPWSQSKYWAGQSDRYDEVHYKRIVLPMILKASQQLFGAKPFPSYLLTKGFFFAGTVTLLFILLALAVPLGMAILGTACFLFVPIHYSHALWIADTATLCYFFLFLGMLILSAIHRNILQRQTWARFGGLLAGLFIAGWIGIKAKELLLVLPLTALMLVLVSYRTWKVAPLKYALLTGIMVFLAFQIVPVTNLGAGSSPGGGFNWRTLLRLFFLNYDCGYDNETVSAFLSWDHVFPVSVARTLGFFLLWGLVICMGIFALRRWVLKDERLLPFLENDLVRIAAIWLCVEIPFLGMFQPDPRYFSGTMAPIVILSARLFYCALSGLRKPLRWGMAAFLLLGVGFNLYENVQSSLSLRIMIGRRLNYFQETARTILQDVKGDGGDDLSLGRFYCSLYRGNPDFETIDDHTYYVELGYDSWNKVEKKDVTPQDFVRKAAEGYRYYVTFQNPDFSAYPEIRLIETVDGMNPGSLIEKMFFRKKKKRPPILKIFRCFPVPGGLSAASQSTS